MADAQETIKKNSFFKSFKKLILVTALLIAGVLLSLAGFGMIEFNPNLFKYTGFGLLGLAFVYHFLYWSLQTSVIGLQKNKNSDD